MRFYHAKIDAGNLTAGEDYSSLRNVVVIFISTYDPFGKKRMVYTIKNGCVEEPDLPYEDGARTIFLYTKGTEGEPPKELKQLALYMEDSTAGNAKTAGLARLHEMVTKVKADRKVGLAYMKAAEIEKRIKAEGMAEGRAEGRAEGKAIKLISQVRKKVQKNKTVEEIAEMLEEDPAVIAPIYELLCDHAEWDDERIGSELAGEQTAVRVNM